MKKSTKKVIESIRANGGFIDDHNHGFVKVVGADAKYYECMGVAIMNEGSKAEYCCPVFKCAYQSLNETWVDEDGVAHLTPIGRNTIDYRDSSVIDAVSKP